MNIRIKKLRLLNFKGIRDLEIDFAADRPVFISGENATGKTTIMDAFLWLLFGKDSFGRTDFNIKTLDANGQVIWKLPHEVEGILDFDGEFVTLRRVLNEKWTKKRGSAIEEFTGHETGYFVDDVPRTQKEYQDIVNDLCPESIFRLITNPGYFPSQRKEFQRGVLIEMAGDISDHEIAGNEQDFITLLAQLNGKSLSDFRKEIAARKKRIKDELDEIPARVDEIKRNMPESHDWKTIEKALKETELEIKSIDEQLSDYARAQQARMKSYDEKLILLSDLKKRRYNKASQIIEKMNEGRNEAVSKLNELQENLARTRGLLSQKITTRDLIERQNKERLSEIDALRGEWKKVFESQIHFSDGQFVCPTCKRPFDEGDIETKKVELTEQFNTSKESALQEITSEGQTLKANLEKYKDQLEEIAHKIRQDEELIIAIQEEITKVTQGTPERVAFSPETVSFPELESIDSEIQALQKEINESKPASPNGENESLKARKDQLQELSRQYLQQLSLRGVIQSNHQRITTLEIRQRELSQELADLERSEFTMAAFSKAKITEVEKRINSRFSLVRFKMFDIQINGAEVETCEATVGGVPYSDLNNAMRINAGLDIINALSAHHNYFAPVWIDNRESVNDLIDINSQLINLVVTRDKQLVINN